MEDVFSTIANFEPEIQDLIGQALNHAVRCDGCSRLFGRPDGLFPGGNTKSRAVSYCLDSKPPLLVREKRVSKRRALHVRPAAGGFQHLIALTKPDKQADLIDEASPVHRQQLLKNWAELAARKNWTADFTGIEACCAKLIGEIEAILPVLQKPDVSGKSEDANFKRDLAHELVISWKFAKSAEAREGIARALRASGVQQIGEAGEQVEFVGRRHLCSDAVFPGDNVEIVTPGWVVHDGVGEYLLEKAAVRAI